jgi:hypothetical protein
VRKEVRAAAVPIMIAESAIGIALTATVFAAIAVFATFFDTSYRRVLELAGGFRSALMPYQVVAVVSALAGIGGLIGALALPAIPTWADVGAIALSSGLCGWAIAGVVSVTELTIFHATQRAQLLGGADHAAQKLATKKRRAG